jgi:LCP family protein required for cell wall assembly
MAHRPPPAPPPGGPERPRYKVYRSRRGLLDRLRPARPDRLGRPRRLREPGPPRERRTTLRRVLKWVVLAALAWILLSVVVFFVSAQTNDGVSDDAKEALSDEGTLLTGSTVLVIGSDERSDETREPGAGTGRGRADTLLLLHVGFGTVRRLSIPRDSLVQIPGIGPGKINAAYANGGAGLAIETVEDFLGNDLAVNHVIEVSFEDFPELIDALGGVDIELKKCVSSNRFGDRRVRLRRGKHHLDGDQALAFARVRHNRCAPNEDDRARARRQQQVLSAMRNQLVHPTNWPGNFVRAPLIAWRAPRSIRTDMKGPGLAALFSDLLTGGGGKTRVLEPSGIDGGGNLTYTEEEKAQEVERLVGD